MADNRHSESLIARQAGQIELTAGVLALMDIIMLTLLVDHPSDNIALGAVYLVAAAVLLVLAGAVVLTCIARFGLGAGDSTMWWNKRRSALVFAASICLAAALIFIMILLIIVAIFTWI